MLLTRDYIAGLLAQDLGTWWFTQSGHIPDDPMGAFWALVDQHSPTPEVARYLEILYQADGLNLSRVPTACQCLVCTEKAEFDEGCRYNGIPPVARMMGNLDVELVAQFWNLPYTVFALAVLHKRYRTRGELKAQYGDSEDRHPTGSKAERMAAASMHALRANNG